MKALSNDAFKIHFRVPCSINGPSRIDAFLNISISYYVLPSNHEGIIEKEMQLFSFLRFLLIVAYISF